MNFTDLTLERIDELRPFFLENKSRICDFTVGGTFMWRDYHKTQFAVDGGTLFFKIFFPVTAYAPPLGAIGGKAPYEKIIDAAGAKDRPLYICCVSEAALDEILSLFPSSKARTDRAWADYLYLSEDLVNLAGRKYAGHRNHINKFIRESSNWSFDKISAENTQAVRDFFIKHADLHVKDSMTYSEGNKKAIEALDNLGLYNMVGGVLRSGGEVVGATLGEAAGDTLYVHVEKADTSCNGAYQMLSNRFARMHAGKGVKYINREEDDGDEGLRKSKTSYHPTQLLSKYMVELRA